MNFGMNLEWTPAASAGAVRTEAQGLTGGVADSRFDLRSPPHVVGAGAAGHGAQRLMWQTSGASVASPFSQCGDFDDRLHQVACRRSSSGLKSCRSSA